MRHRTMSFVSVVQGVGCGRSMAQGISWSGFLEMRSWMVVVKRTDPGSGFVHRLSNAESYCAFANCFTPVVEPVHMRSFFCIRT
jgi:hypothetical protein